MSARSLLGLALLLLLPLPGNDDLDDHLDSAQRLAAAGKLDRALSLVDALSVVHPDDPRVHYRRYRLLKSLDRLNDAADCLERAESTLAEWRRKGLKNGSITALEEPMAAESNAVLSFRRETQKLLKAYHDGALTIAGKLTSPPEEPFVLSILEELYRADASGMEQLLAIWGRASIESRRTHEQRQDKFKSVGEGGVPPDQAAFERKIADAEKLHKAGSFNEAKAMAVAALEVLPGNASALALLAEILTRLDQVEESALAALLALDAPKTGDAKQIQEVYDRAFQQLHSPELRSFARLKSKTCQDLLALRDKAREATRPADEDWIERRAVRLTPGEPSVIAGIDKARLAEEIRRRHPSLGKARPSLGTIDLLSVADLWRWQNRTPASGVGEDTLTLVPHNRDLMVEAYPRGIKLTKAFSLQFKLGYDIRPKQEPWLYIVFDANRKSGNIENSVVLFPESDHVLCFASRRPNEPWIFRDRQPLPEGKARGATWSLVEIDWNDATKKLKVTVEGQRALAMTLDEEDTLDGPWHVGLGGSAVKVQLKDFRLRIQD
jgi:hypothetical protein